MSTETTRVCEESSRVLPPGVATPLDAISEPGAYICGWSGHLLRVPEDAVNPGGRSPRMKIVGGERLMVTKISDNPYITLSKAKLLASSYDLGVSF